MGSIDLQTLATEDSYSMNFKNVTIISMIGIFLLISVSGAAWVPFQLNSPEASRPQAAVLSSSQTGTLMAMEISGMNVVQKSEGSEVYDLIELPEAGSVYEVGNPHIPALRERVAIPRNADYRIEVDVREEITLQDYHLWPVQPSYDRGAPKPPFTLNQKAYAGNAFYPAQVARISEEAWMRDMRTVTVEITPVRFNPATGELRVAVDFDIRVVTSGGSDFGVTEAFPSFYSIYKKHIVNFEYLDIALRSDPEPMLIIAYDDLMDDMQSYIEWKTKRGVDVTMVGTSETGTSSSAIQSYIETVYATWNPKPVYIVFVGDAPQINPLYGIGSCASDYMFTTLEGGDHVPDVFISRFSAQNAGELAPQLDKLLNYEITPLDGEWLNKFAGLASDEGSGPSDEEYSQQVEARLLAHNSDAVADRIYQSMGHGATQISAAVNDGRFWLSYFGHGSGTSWSAPSFTNANVDALTNGYATPWIMDVSCSNGYFNGSSDCFAERWLKGGSVGNPHGAVGMYSSSTSCSWDEPATLAWGVTYAIAGDGSSVPGGFYRMGQLTYEGMLFLMDEMGTGSNVQEVLQQYVLFGDCAGFIRSDALIDPVVTHLPNVPVAPFDLQVTVGDSKAPVEGAEVCAYKPGEVHVVGITDASGMATLSIEPITVGNLILTVTGENLVPYEAVLLASPTGCGMIGLNKSLYNCDDEIIVTLYEDDLNLDPGVADTAQVDISSDSETTPEIIDLTETGPDTSQFQGSIMTSDSNSGAGYLLLTDGDTITVHYYDADCEGSPNDVYEYAAADCVGPVISGITVSDIGTDTFTVSWTTDENSDSVLIWGDTTPPMNEETDPAFVMSHEITLADLEPCTEYYFAVRSTDSSGNIALDDNGGSYYMLTTLQLMLMLSENMDTDPGWNYEGQWAWGEPAGSGGDPDSGYTGNNVVGYNLNGQYGNNLSATYVTTSSFDCSGASQAYLSYWEWLGVESSTYDHASLEISGDGGSTWSVIWEHSGSSLEPSSWSYKEYDISTWAAGQSDVQLRWSMGPTDTSVVYCGWNIDDVEVSYTAPCNVPLLNYESHSIDDSAGNNDGEINAGETISMAVTLMNNGTAATGVNATLSTSNPHVTITTAASNYPDIPQSGSGTNLQNFVFEVSPEAENDETINFTLAWSCAGNSGSTAFSEMVVAPTVGYSDSLVLDGDMGDGDGILDPGETAQIMVTLANSGSGTASNLSAVLSSDQPGYVTINDDTATYPDIAPGGMGTSEAPYYQVTIDPSTPESTWVTFTLDIMADGYARQVTFSKEITSSTFALRYNWNMDTDPAWTTEGLWEYGVPQGNDGDPTSGHTGDNVYGYNLAGEYENSLSETYLTSTPINCSNLSSVEIRFWRWLGV